MADYVRLNWASDLDRGSLSRRDRQGGVYSAYVPDPLLNRAFALAGDTAADLADAEAAIVRLDSEAKALTGTEVLSRLLLRAEAVASSRIEGLEVGARRLLRAEAARSLDEQPSDATAVEVLANIEAMAAGVAAVRPGQEITIELLLAMHSRLLGATKLGRHAGSFRRQQNWIGGSSYNPCSAAYVPPPPEYVVDLMADLVAFCNTADLPAVAQAAIAHAQFETIHPFVDGNGRIGRALIHLVLRRRGLTTRVLPPVSLVLATQTRDYIAGLTLFRHVGLSTSDSATGGLNDWVSRFAAACSRAVVDAAWFESAVAELELQWRRRVSPVRAGSATDLLLRALPAAPVVTVSTAASLIGRAYSATNDAIARLVAAGVLKQVSVGRRNRAFESPDAITAFTALE
ncbi:MAG: Fic family protein, partial [Mycobacteriaceae bacterium]|nr:Fic family protein [Mycobacteriaceae bacterium]